MENALSAAWAALVFAPVFWYTFIYWNAKEFSRRLFHVGALSFFSVSIIFFFAEVVLEFGSSSRLLPPNSFLASYISQFLYSSKPVMVSCFAIASVIFLVHHQKERKHANTEYRLAENIWTLLESRGSATTIQGLVASTLPIINNAFERFSVQRVCFWQPDGEQLVVNDDCIFPDLEGADETYLRRLKKETGVAGLVYRDMLLRYVPRLYFPFNTSWLRKISMWFPHALTFEVRKVHGELDIVRPNVDLSAVVVSSNGRPRHLRSFVAVPVKSSDGKCHGVLCVDFNKTDPLERIDIKMAAVLGMLFAEDIRRLPG